MALTNPLHIAFIAVVALLVLGPKRLPEIAKTLGKGMREFRESLNADTTVDHAPPPEVTAAPAPPPAPDHQPPTA
jgi:sec-independent protein translocase protein TatA